MTHGSLVLLPTPTPACPAGVLLPPGCAPRRGPARWRGARDGPRLSAVTVRIAQSEIASAGHRPQKSRRALRAPARRKRAPGGRAARLESPEAGESPSRRLNEVRGFLQVEVTLPLCPGREVILLTLLSSQPST
ncbi:uncharacterized protein LOC122683890 isoform X5 [Cervus elaphus]|uniref:uncharacterized protein LOC122454551 isoform X4 n=1 Tax=Cervus canadensis TaxID=1574408 RepID=UPI001C9E3A9A|nr:uncharacterized protein LOC122454551 isoform X4 [Cervus canadensis]XP_043743744.1 uncharacterized protein LOC122683890 isoform X5 [Cervus elaphus]